MNDTRCASYSWHRGRHRPCRLRAVITINGIGYCEEHAALVRHGYRPPSMPRQWQHTQASLLDQPKGKRP